MPEGQSVPPEEATREGQAGLAKEAWDSSVLEAQLAEAEGQRLWHQSRKYESIVAPSMEDLEDQFRGHYDRLRAEGMAATERLSRLEEAAGKLASRLHEKWRQEWHEVDQAKKKPEGKRIKPTTDQEWIEAHGADMVDIANTAFEDLPADWQEENLAAAKVVVDILDRPDVPDLDDPATRDAIGNRIHLAWIARNKEYAQERGLDKHFRDLPEVEQDKDLAQVQTALELFQPQK